VGGGETEDESLLATARAAGVIRVGFFIESPFSFADEEGRLSGVNPELTRRILSNMGIPEMDGVLSEFASLIPGLKARRFDIIASGLSITAERCQEVAFSDPIWTGLSVFAVRKDHPVPIETFQDVATSGVSIGMVTGAREVQIAEAAGVQSSQITAFPDIEGAIAGLRAGRVDAVPIGKITFDLLGQKMDLTDLSTTTPFRPVEDKPDGVGIAFRPEDSDFRDQFNDQLAELQASGEVEDIAEEFGLDVEGVREAAELQWEQICSTAE
jgi:polar amino acid transport system substrate-binding protein